MNESFRDIDAATPATGGKWMRMSDSERLDRIRTAIESNASAPGIGIVAVAAHADGQVLLRFDAPVGADRRGTVLLDIEQMLKSEVDPALNVWLEPLGDRNSLRNLRGIEIKA